MPRSKRAASAALIALLLAVPAGRTAAWAGAPVQLRLDSLAGLDALHLSASVTTHLGRTCVRLADEPGAPGSRALAGGHGLAIVGGSDFGDGTIEADIAGQPRAGASEQARGFVGLAFRVQARGSRFECFYLRPTNGRADDQVRRNHATQYISEPGYPWDLLRKNSPGKYESYVDLVPGEWTHVKIVVADSSARLYVGGAEQPCLIVDDLKQGITRGKVALWIGPETEAWFSNLRVWPAPR
jgi:hypothetical protein